MGCISKGIWYHISSSFLHLSVEHFSKTGVNYLLSEVTDFPNLISILHILFYYVTWILNSCQLYCQKWKINLNSFYKQTIWGTHIVKKIHLWAETSYQKLVSEFLLLFFFNTHFLLIDLWDYVNKKERNWR